LKAELANKKFTHKLLECYDELVNCREKTEHQEFYKKYFIVKEQPKRGRKVFYNEEEIQNHKQNHVGWFVLVSNHIKDAAEALKVYRQKDTVEKSFDDLKNDLDMKRLRIHSNAAMDGQIFIQFVALILTTYLKVIMEENGWMRNHSLQDVFSEMKSLKQVSVEGKRKKLVTTPTKRQQEIMELYQVSI
jgi:transposase